MYVDKVHVCLLLNNLFETFTKLFIIPFIEFVFNYKLFFLFPILQFLFTIIEIRFSS